MLQAFKEFKVYACHDLAEGGLAVALAEMCIGGGVGCKVDLTGLRGDDYVKLFSESNTRWLVEVEDEEFVKFMRSRGLNAYAIGVVEGDAFEVKGCFSITVEELDKAWRNGLTRFTGW